MALTPKVKEIILDGNTPATVLLVLAVDLLSEELLTWDPATVRMELEEMAGAKLPPASLNRLMAAVEIVTSDGFYRDLPTFVRLCNTLYNGTLDLETWDPADAGEVAWGITEALLLWPPDPQDEEPFDHKIVEYIGFALKDEGIMRPPDVLQLGILPKDVWAEVQNTFSDDPQMFAAIYDVEAAKTEEINQMVKARLRTILTLLDETPLQVGDAKDSVKNMLAALKRTEEKSDELKPV